MIVYFFCAKISSIFQITCRKYREAIYSIFAAGSFGCYSQESLNTGWKENYVRLVRYREDWRMAILMYFKGYC